MEIVSVSKLVYPVLGFDEFPGNGTPNVSNMKGDVYGTAFWIGGDYYLTAGHVMKGALEHERIALGMLDDPVSILALPISDSHIEIKAEIDLALFKVQGVIKPVKYNFATSNEVPLNQEVLSVGYPFAVDRDIGGITFRSFKGHIVGSGRRHIGDDRRPFVYELSYMCPKGLSGSPLITDCNTPQILGLVIGNTDTSITIFSEKEVAQEGNAINSYERTESMHLGIALMSFVFLDMKFELLDNRSINEVFY